MASSDRPRNPLRPGIYCPIMTFFDANEDLDLPTLRSHVVRLARAGLQGLVTMGSNGEAVHLSREERITVTKTAREALDSAGFPHIPLIVGATDQSVRGTLQLCRDAADAGGEYVLLVTASYYRGFMDTPAIESYYKDVADESPLPVVIYNFPGAVAGIDLDSDTIIRISQHPNVVGTKFTCGSTGKLTRVSTAMSSKAGDKYMSFGGFADFTLQSHISGGSGIIGGGANVMPHACVRVWDLASAGKLDEASALQKVLSQGDWVLAKTGVAGTKYGIQKYFGYGGVPRRPLPQVTLAEKKWIDEGTSEVMKIEMRLAKEKGDSS